MALKLQNYPITKLQNGSILVNLGYDPNIHLDISLQTSKSICFHYTPGETTTNG